VWFFPIKKEKETRCDTGTQKLAEPIHPEICPVRQSQHSNANGDGGVESAPGNLSDGNGLSEHGESNRESIKLPEVAGAVATFKTV
jgi:hypothetical protein